MVVELREGAAPEAQGQQWQEGDYAARDAVFAALGVHPFGRRQKHEHTAASSCAPALEKMLR